jgi:hypothetical protein
MLLFFTLIKNLNLGFVSLERNVPKNTTSCLANKVANLVLINSLVFINSLVLINGFMVKSLIFNRFPI